MIKRNEKGQFVSEKVVFTKLDTNELAKATGNDCFAFILPYCQEDSFNGNKIKVELFLYFENISECYNISICGSVFSRCWGVQIQPFKAYPEICKSEKMIGRGSSIIFMSTTWKEAVEEAKKYFEKETKKLIDACNARKQALIDAGEWPEN